MPAGRPRPSAPVIVLTIMVAENRRLTSVHVRRARLLVFDARMGFWIGAEINGVRGRGRRGVAGYFTGGPHILSTGTSPGSRRFARTPYRGPVASCRGRGSRWFSRGMRGRSCRPF
jgi:hypothetical protein